MFNNIILGFSTENECPLFFKNFKIKKFKYCDSELNQNYIDYVKNFVEHYTKTNVFKYKKIGDNYMIFSKKYLEMMKMEHELCTSFLKHKITELNTEEDELCFFINSLKL